MLQGALLADFSSFQREVDKAIVELRTFETGSSKVSASLSRMTDSFSGRKVIQDATLMAKAVEDIGGTSKLTEKEFQRLGATANEAVAKMKAMGMDVPPGLQRIANETTKVDAAHGSLLGSVKNVALGFAAMFTARAAMNFVGDVIEEAGALKDLSTQTRINVEDLQVLGGAMSEFGVDADEVGKGIFKLSRGIAGGDDSVARGLHMMGMSLKEVEGLNGKELFLKIESGLATLQGGLRDTAAAELYGGKLGAAMAGASEGIVGAMADAKRLNVVMTGESVDAMDRYDESIKRAQKSLGAMTGNIIGPVAEGFNEYIDLVQKAGFWTTTWARFTDSLTDTLEKDGTAFATLKKEIEEGGGATGRWTTNTVAATVASVAQTAALTEQAQHVKFMAALEADAGVKLNAFQVANLAHLKEIGALNAENAAAIGVNASQYDAYTAAVERAKKMETDRAAAEKEAAKLQAGSLLALTKLQEDYTLAREKQSGTATDIEIAGIRKRYAILEAELKKAGTLTEAISKQMAANMAEDIAGVRSGWAELSGKSREALQQMADQAAKDYDRMLHSGLHFSREVLDTQRDKVRQLQAEARGMGTAYVEAFEEAQRAAAELLVVQQALREEERKRQLESRALGGSFEITRENFAATARGLGQDAGLIETLLKKGYSMQQAMLWARHPDWPPPEHPGPRVPGFAGGVRNFGGGLARVHEGELLVNMPRGSNVIPSGSGGGVAASYGVAPGDRAEWDALNAQQAALWLANGKIVDAAQQQLIDAMRRLEGGLTADRAEWDRLNTQQAALWLDAGRVVTAEQQKLIQLMEPLTPAGFGKIASAIQPVHYHVTVTVGNALSSKQELARYVQEAMVDLARAKGQRFGGH